MNVGRFVLTVGGDIATYANELCEAAEANGVFLRLFGSCAIRIKCAEHSDILDRCNRYPKDIDAVIHHPNRNRLRAMVLATGWEEDIEQTAQTDGAQLRFRHLDRDVVLDLSVDKLRFAQTLDVRNRIKLDRPTLPAADLLLSKLQIPEITRSDLIDSIALLHAATPDRSDGNAIDLRRVIEVTSRSWRWFKSVMVALEAIDSALTECVCNLTERERDVVSSRLDTVRRAVLDAPKTVWWKLRSFVGEALPWRNNVEMNPEWRS